MAPKLKNPPQLQAGVENNSSTNMEAHRAEALSASLHIKCSHQIVLDGNLQVTQHRISGTLPSSSVAGYQVSCIITNTKEEELKWSAQNLLHQL